MKVRRRAPHRHRGEVVFHLLEFTLGYLFVFQPIDLDVDRRLNVARGFRLLGLATDVEHTSIFASQLVGKRRGRHLVAKHERLVQPARTPG